MWQSMKLYYGSNYHLKFLVDGSIEFNTDSYVWISSHESYDSFRLWGKLIETNIYGLFASKAKFHTGKAA